MSRAAPQPRKASLRRRLTPPRLDGGNRLGEFVFGHLRAALDASLLGSRVELVSRGPVRTGPLHRLLELFGVHRRELIAGLGPQVREEFVFFFFHVMGDTRLE